MRGYKKYTIYIENIKKYGNSYGEYTCTKPSYITKTIIDICNKCDVPKFNLDFSLDMWEENVYVKIFCTFEQLKKIKIELLNYQDRFYINKVEKGFKKV